MEGTFTIPTGTIKAEGIMISGNAPPQGSPMHPDVIKSETLLLQ